MTKRIVINASAARLGGAKSIVDSYVNWVSAQDRSSQFLLLSPQCPDNLPANMQHRTLSTEGAMTLLFSCFGVLWYCLLHRAGTCLSFNNINLVLPVCRRITYFHQAKVFTSSSLRFRLIAAAIRLLRGSRIVVQSPLIADMFRQHFGNGFDICTKWPGIDVPATVNAHSGVAIPPDKTTWLWPVTDPTVAQKNLHWMQTHAEWFEQQGIQLLVTCEQQPPLSFAMAVGLLPKDKLFALYREVQAVVVVSTEETVCLPIFEAASVGTPVWVLRKPYIEAIATWRGLPAEVSVFDTVEEITLQPRGKSTHTEKQQHYFLPDWHIY